MNYPAIAQMPTLFSMVKVYVTEDYAVLSREELALLWSKDHELSKPPQTVIAFLDRDNSRVWIKHEGMQEGFHHLECKYLSESSTRVSLVVWGGDNGKAEQILAATQFTPGQEWMDEDPIPIVGKLFAAGLNVIIKREKDESTVICVDSRNFSQR